MRDLLRSLMELFLPPEVILHKCDAMLLSYVPDVSRNALVDFGVVLLEHGWPGAGFAGLKLTDRWTELESAHPNIDVELLRAMAEELANDLAESRVEQEDGALRGELLKRFEDQFSNNVRLSQRRVILTIDPEAELEALAASHLTVPKTKNSTLDQDGI